MKCFFPSILLCVQGSVFVSWAIVATRITEFPSWDTPFIPKSRASRCKSFEDYRVWDAMMNNPVRGTQGNVFFSNSLNMEKIQKCSLKSFGSYFCFVWRNCPWLWHAFLKCWFSSVVHFPSFQEALLSWLSFLLDRLEVALPVSGCETDESALFSRVLPTLPHGLSELRGTKDQKRKGGGFGSSRDVLVNERFFGCDLGVLFFLEWDFVNVGFWCFFVAWCKWRPVSG